MLQDNFKSFGAFQAACANNSLPQYSFMPLQGSLTIERMCELTRVSRAGFYRSLNELVPSEEEMEVRAAVQQIALEHRRRYGYRRICAELRRRGMQMNHKRVLGVMRKDNLLALRRRRFVVTTNSNHKLEVYLNLARRMKLSAKDQLWVADLAGMSGLCCQLNRSTQHHPIH